MADGVCMCIRWIGKWALFIVREFGKEFMGYFDSIVKGKKKAPS